eukprot:scaffold279722_cov26-Prasinocladus_malaysianus.AAC.1
MLYNHLSAACNVMRLVDSDVAHLGAGKSQLPRFHQFACGSGMLSDRERVSKFAKLVDPVVRRVDDLVGEKVVWPSLFRSKLHLLRPLT